MFSHVILGLLRDGRGRYGYELKSEFEALSGGETNQGNFYRELGKLSGKKLVATRDAAPSEDQRRIYYSITDEGRLEFDVWLRTPTTPEQELSSWAIFAAMLTYEILQPLLDRTRAKLWLEGKTLEGARLDALGRASREGDPEFSPTPLLLLRKLKSVTVDIEFLDDLRAELERSAKRDGSVRSK